MHIMEGHIILCLQRWQRVAELMVEQEQRLSILIQTRWREEYEVLRRKFELDNEVGSVGRLMNKIKARNEKDWEEESTLK